MLVVVLMRTVRGRHCGFKLFSRQLSNIFALAGGKEAFATINVPLRRKTNSGSE